MNHPGEIAGARAHRGADRRAGQQRAARASGVHGQRRGGGARERHGARRAGARRRRGVPGRRRARAAVARACRPRAASRRSPFKALPTSAPTRLWRAAHWVARSSHARRRLPACVLRAAGRHNVHNALAAVACTLAAGAPLDAIRSGLEAFEPVKGRSRVIALARGMTLVDDSYNANPDSVRAAIDLLASLPGPRWLVLGDMGEVGDRGPEFHAEVGAYAQHRVSSDVGGGAALHACRGGVRHGAALCRCRVARRCARCGAIVRPACGQRLALHEDGTRRRGAARRRRPMLLSLTQWLATQDAETSASCACSST